LAPKKTSRIRYQIAGKDYNAISITTNTDKVYENEIYDLATGLLLSSSRSYEGNAVAVNNGGNLGQGRGARFISHVRFMGMRKINVPWANAPRRTGP
jgi:hypothetical protein